MCTNIRKGKRNDEKCISYGALAQIILKVEQGVQRNI